jgi:hypothetical protein
MAVEKDTNHWGRSLNSGRLTSKEAETLAVVLCPLHQAPRPPLPQADGSYVAGPMQYVYQPFTTTNLLNWRQHTPAHSEEPQAVIELLTNIIHSHQPHWDDCRQLMSTPFTSDERQQVYQAAKAWLVTHAPPQTANPEQWEDERILDTRPDWDPNTPARLQSIQRMRQAILEGACQGAQGATNLARVSEVTQKPDELPS